MTRVRAPLALSGDLDRLPALLSRALPRAGLRSQDVCAKAREAAVVA